MPEYTNSRPLIVALAVRVEEVAVVEADLPASAPGAQGQSCDAAKSQDARVVGRSSCAAPGDGWDTATLGGQAGGVKQGWVAQ